MAKTGALRRWVAAPGLVAGLGIAAAEAADNVTIGYSPGRAPAL